MALVRIEKVNALPGTTVADTIYAVKNGAGFDWYITSSANVVTAMNAGAGGTDPWTYVKLAAGFTNSTITQNASPLAFALLPDKTYVVEGMLIVQSSAITTGIRPGIIWPVSGNLGNLSANINVANSATTVATRNWGSTVSSASAASLATAVANENTYADVSATFSTTSAFTTGNFAISLASEVAASQVILMMNSWIRYRTI